MTDRLVPVSGRPRVDARELGAPRSLPGSPGGSPRRRRGQPGSRRQQISQSHAAADERDRRRRSPRELRSGGIGVPGARRHLRHLQARQVRLHAVGHGGAGTVTVTASVGKLKSSAIPRRHLHLRIGPLAHRRAIRSNRSCARAGAPGAASATWRRSAARSTARSLSMRRESSIHACASSASTSG